MGKVAFYFKNVLQMKKTIYFLAIFAILSACREGNQENGHNELQPADTTVAEVILEKPADIAYTQCPLAYLIDGQLYFHSFDDNKKVKFVEESDTIFNFTFDAEGKTLYYSVERDGSLWLKSAVISDSKITPQWVVDWKLKKDDCITDTYGEISPLLYHKGELLMEHGFVWDYYDFRKFDIYSIAGKEKKSLDKESDGRVLGKFMTELPRNKADQYFKTTKQQLYYTRNNVKVCLSDKLDFNVLRNKESEDYWVETEFISFTLSPDETKILYGTIIEMGDLGHGPYCIANKDGSNQMILEQTDIGSNKNPVWLKNNSIIFTDYEKNLFVANNDELSIQKIAENVSLYAAR
jgi:hypothetical protein